jgi:transcriptional regulator PpsR
VKLFRSPQQSLGNLDAEAAATLIAAAADIALVLDDAGVIRDVAFNNEDMARELEAERSWLGRPWTDTVTEETRPKVEAFLREARTERASRWRHLNHMAGGASLPILYSIIRIEGTFDRLLAFGRDLRPLSQLQQRLVQAQQSMERDYSRLRHAETRYRLLFQMSAEAVLVLDAGSLAVVEANEAARRLAGGDAERPAARPFLDLFDEPGREAVQLLLASVRAVGRAEDARVRLAESGAEVTVSASLFRQDGATLFLARVVTGAGDAAIVLPKPQRKLLKAVESAPDAFVVTTQQGRIVIANAAFLDLAQLSSLEQAREETLDRWLGRPGVDFDVLTATLNSRGSVRLFATVLRGEHGASADVEVSAVAVLNGGKPCFGFAIRDIGARLPAERPATPGRSLPRSVEQLTELIGRVPLKDLVREATDVIERLAIEAALELSGDNRASAAEMLGLSRQSLYVKLRRYGLGDLGAAEPSGAA